MTIKTILMATLSLCGPMSTIAGYYVTDPGGTRDDMPGNILVWKVQELVYDDEDNATIRPYTDCISTVYRDGVAIATVPVTSSSTSYRDLDVLAGSTNMYFVTAMGVTSTECKKVCELSYTMTTNPVASMVFSADGGTQTTTISGTQSEWSRVDGYTHSALNWQAQPTGSGWTAWLSKETSGDELSVTAKKLTGETPRQAIINITLKGYVIASIAVSQSKLPISSDVLVPTDSGDVIVPGTWFDAYPDLAKEHGSNEAAATATAANGMKVWECYVAGLDPTNANSRFEAKIEVKDGVPAVTWTPNLNESELTRVYTIYGKESLGSSEDWVSPTNSLHRFFKVGVEMP